MGTLSYLNLNRILSCTLAEGPGRRFCLWVQGCKRHCVGCCNADMLEVEPRELVSVAEVCDMVKDSKSKHDIEGVTFLGGEPMLQATNLSLVAKCAHGLGLSVMVFTGYTYAECLSGDVPGARELLSETDVLVDGPFVATRLETVRNWVGSVNQRFHYLTNRYSAVIETDPAFRGVVEFREGGGVLCVNGCPRLLERLKPLKDALREVTSI